MKYIKVAYFSQAPEHGPASFSIGSLYMKFDGAAQFPSEQTIVDALKQLNPELRQRKNLIVLGITTFNSFEDCIHFNSGINPFTTEFAVKTT